MNSILKRSALSISVLGLAILTGCASTVAGDPFETEISGTYSTAPGADGVTTTYAVRCTLKGRLPKERFAHYVKNPRELIDDDQCKAFDRVAIHGSPALAGELVKATATAATGGTVNYLVQRALQKKQGEICANGGCVNTINNNVAYAEGGEGGKGGDAKGGDAAALSQSAAGSSASVESSGSGCRDGSC